MRDTLYEFGGVKMQGDPGYGQFMMLVDTVVFIMKSFKFFGLSLFSWVMLFAGIMLAMTIAEFLIEKLGE